MGDRWTDKSQEFLLFNLTQSQSVNTWINSCDATKVLHNKRYYGNDLALFLVDLGRHNQRDTLEQCCLNVIARQFCQLPTAFKDILPSHLVSKLEVAILSQHNVGVWAGDRLMSFGNFSSKGPFPPGAKCKAELSGELYDLAAKFQCNHYSQVSECMWCASKIFDKPMIVANLDKKEYLDPKAYQANEITLRNIIQNQNCKGVMMGLLLKLIYMSNYFTNFPTQFIAYGPWAGHRIAICTLESLEDADTYSDTSNPDDFIRYCVVTANS